MSDAAEQGAGAGGVEDPLGPPAADESFTDGTAPDAADDGGAGPADGAPDRTGDAPVDAATTDPGTGGAGPGSSVEQLIEDLEQAARDRDDYLDALRRNQADFENFRKRIAKQSADDAARAAEDLVDKLLPVLDACDAAVHHGATEVEPIYAALLGTLEKEGLERIAPAGEAFDPNRHEAVMHEAAEDGAADGPVVSDVMRAGFAWKGRVIRPAMVKVKG